MMDIYSGVLRIERVKNYISSYPFFYSAVYLEYFFKN